MQHFPPNNCDAQPVWGTGEHRNAERWLDRRAAQDSRPPAEILPENDEFDPTNDWLAHLAAGRIEVR
jgi:hypothetical protein